MDREINHHTNTMTRAQAEDVQTRIVNAARELFIKKGYYNTSIRDISAMSKTNVAMVNYYYRSKYKLFEIVFEENLNILFNRIFNVFNAELPLDELLGSWVNSYYETLIEYPQIPTFVMTEININPEGLTQRIKQRNPAAVFCKIEKRLNEEVAKGTIRQTPAPDFMLNVLALCVFPFLVGQLAMAIADKTNEEYHKVLEDHKKYVIEFILNALRP